MKLTVAVENKYFKEGMGNVRRKMVGYAGKWRKSNHRNDNGVFKNDNSKSKTPNEGYPNRNVPIKQNYQLHESHIAFYVVVLSKSTYGIWKIVDRYFSGR